METCGSWSHQLWTLSPAHIHCGDGHVGVDNGVLLDVVVLKLLFIDGIDLVHVSDGIDLVHLSGSVDLVHVSPDLEPPGVLWVDD